MKLDFENIIKTKIKDVSFDYDPKEWDKLKKALNKKIFWTKRRLYISLIVGSIIMLSGITLFLLFNRLWKDTSENNINKQPLFANETISVVKTDSTVFSKDSNLKSVYKTVKTIKTEKSSLIETKLPYQKTVDEFKSVNDILNSSNELLPSNILNNSTPSNYASLFYINDLSGGCLPLSINPNAGYFLLNATYFWDFGDGNTSYEFAPKHHYTKAGTYFLKLSIRIDNQIIHFSDSVFVYPTPSVNFEWKSNQNIYHFYVNNDNDKESQFTWKIDDKITSKESYFESTLMDNTNYLIKLIVENKFQCSDSVTKSLIVNKIHNYWVPNSFTPNGDGSNDEFGAIGSELYELNYHLFIYDISGILIFESTNPDVKWNGINTHSKSNNLEDLFIWKIVTKDKSGNTYTNTGTVSRIMDK